jgi:hypothetical protein
MNQPILYFNPEPFQDSEPLLEDCNAIYDKLIETTTKALSLLQEQKLAGNIRSRKKLWANY